MYDYDTDLADEEGKGWEDILEKVALGEQNQRWEGQDYTLPGNLIQLGYR